MCTFPSHQSRMCTARANKWPVTIIFKHKADSSRSSQRKSLPSKMLRDALDQVSSSERQPSLHQAVSDSLLKRKRVSVSLTGANTSTNITCSNYNTNLKAMQKWQNDWGWDRAAVPLRASGTGWWWGFCRCGSVWGCGRWSSMGYCSGRNPSRKPPDHGSHSSCIRLSLPGGGPPHSGQPEESHRQELS